MTYDKAIKHGRVFVDGHFIHTNVYIKQGKIKTLSTKDCDAHETCDAQGMDVLPGLIDPHVHFELDLGFIQSVDDFYHGSVAGAYGGITSFIDFLDPVDTNEGLIEAFNRRKKRAENSLLDYTFHATFKNPKDDLETMVKTMLSLGIKTLKVFTTYSDSDRRTYDEDIIQLLTLSAKYHFVLLVHVENDDLITLDDAFKVKDLPISRPTESETNEALKLAGYVNQFGGSLYMVHTSSGNTLEALKKRYSNILNKNFFIESCPQYFTFNRDKLTQDDGYLYTFAPPLRDEEERRKLFQYEHMIDTFGTDHCAFMRQDKKQDLLRAIPLGIGGIEHSFSVMRHHLGDSVIPRMSERVAEIHQLAYKGRIQENYDADLAVFKPRKNHVITENHARSDYSVYTNCLSAGEVMHTMVRGEWVLKDRQIYHRQGQWIERRQTHESLD